MPDADPLLDPPLPGSLAQLEGLDIAKGAYGGPRVARLSRTLRVPLDALSLGELRFLLSEGRFVDRLIPRTLDRLAADPLLSADGRPGDLLLTTLAAADSAWDSAPAWRDGLAHVLAEARARLDRSVPSADTELRDELDLACDRFLAA